MLQRFQRWWITLVSLALFVACGGATPSETQSTQFPVESEPRPATLTTAMNDATPSTTPAEQAANDTYPIDEPHSKLGDPAIVWSLDERVDVSPIILIATVKARDDTFNMARNQSDLQVPDPHVLVLGQTYELAVERCLRGNGSEAVTIVQAEGFLSSEDEPIESASSIRPEIANQARVGYEAAELEIGERYMFFLDPLPWSDEYLGPAFGAPWLFRLPEVGVAKPVSPFPEVNETFEALPVDEFIAVIEQLLANAD